MPANINDNSSYSDHQVYMPQAPPPQNYSKKKMPEDHRGNSAAHHMNNGRPLMHGQNENEAYPTYNPYNPYNPQNQ